MKAVCPEWCAGGHRCTAAVGGEHRSDPLTIKGVVLTWVAGARGERVELRTTVRLARGSDQARQLAAAVDLAIRAVLAGDVERLAPMIERINGSGERTRRAGRRR